MLLQKAYQTLLADICVLRGIHLDVPNDIPMSWILIDGPKLDKDLLRYLEYGGDETPAFPEWIKPLWEAFVTSDDARVLASLRQALVFCYKAEFEPTNEQIETAEMQFLETDADVGSWDDWFVRTGQTDLIFRTARRILSRCICNVKWSEITPKHGPGAVYPPRVPMHKSRFSTLYRGIQECYPYDQFFCGLYSYWNEVMVEEKNMAITEESDIVCNLIPVPKDSRGPRLIAVHPAEAIWIQQGQRLLLEDAIIRDPVIGRSINFSDQKVNGSKALSASIDRAYVTLDLKEASDRIGSELVKYLFGYASRFLFCSRASHIKVGKRVHELRKFAPMGNCLTFPVQSLVFYSLVRAGIRCHYGIDCVDIYVFGDDIVFPSKYYDGAMRGLIMSGLIPNMNKTFRHGFFRESCGVDAYKGIDVTPQRIKIHELNSYSEVMSACTLAKSLRMRGYDSCSSFIYSLVRRFVGKLHLSSNPLTQGIFEYVKSTETVWRYEDSLRFNRNLQRWEVRCLLVQASVIAPLIGDWYHLQDSLLSLEHSSLPYRDRGTEYPVPYRERLTYGWTPLPLA